MKPWSVKKKRIVIGTLMMFGFLNLIYTFNFLFMFGNIKLILLGMLVFHYFWLSSVLLIILCYHVLTKVYKYKDVKKE